MSNKTCVDTVTKDVNLTICDFCGEGFNEQDAEYWTREFDVPMKKIVPAGTPVPTSDTGVTLIPCPRCYGILKERREHVLVDAYLSKEFKENPIVQKSAD